MLRIVADNGGLFRCFKEFVFVRVVRVKSISPFKGDVDVFVFIFECSCVEFIFEIVVVFVFVFTFVFMQLKFNRFDNWLFVVLDVGRLLEGRVDNEGDSM